MTTRIQATTTTVLLLGLLLLLPLLVVSCDSSADSATTSARESAPKLDRLIPGGQKLQRGRQQLIQKLIKQGVFTKTSRPGSILRVYTGRAWPTLPIDDKQQFVSVVYAYEFAGKRPDPYMDIVEVWDGFTGKKLGYLCGDDGLHL